MLGYQILSRDDRDKILREDSFMMLLSHFFQPLRKRVEQNRLTEQPSVVVPTSQNSHPLLDEFPNVRQRKHTSWPSLHREITTPASRESQLFSPTHSAH